MKTSVPLILILSLLTVSACAQIVPVDLTTPHAVGGKTITGDPMVTAFGKVNDSMDWLHHYCDTNGMTNTALSFRLDTLNTNLLAVSNLVNGALVTFATFPAFTNWFFPDYQYNITNLNARVATALTSYILTLTNAVNLATVSNLTEQVAFDFYYYMATNTVPADVQAATANFGNYMTTNTLPADFQGLTRGGSSGIETVVIIHSENGSTWYLHVDDTGIFTVSTFP